MSPQTKIHIVVDLETLGVNRSSAPIYSIGAWRWVEGQPMPELPIAIERDNPDYFQRFVSPSDLNKYKALVPESSTVAYTFTHVHEEFRQAIEKGEPLRSVLTDFINWCSVQGNDPYFYGNSPSFDIEILRTNLAAVGLDFRIPFRSEMDIRTMRSIMADLGMSRFAFSREYEAFPISRPLVLHSAFDDAYSELADVVRFHRDVLGAIRR